MRTMKEHACCYANCPRQGAIHIGVNGGDCHWICWHHLDRWNQTRARFLAEGGCEMEELGEPLCDECWDEAKIGDVLR
jgi:hypothetical protein